MILPKQIPVAVGDAIAHVAFFAQIEDKCRLLVVKEIKEERPSGGEWNGEPPTWRSVVFESTLFTKDQVKHVLAIKQVEDEKTKKMVDRIYIN